MQGTKIMGKGDLRQVQGVVPSDADHLHSTILSLVEELSVTRDRADAFERLLEQSGVLNSTPRPVSSR